MNKNNILQYKLFTKTPWDTNSSIYYTMLLFISITYPIFFDNIRINELTNQGYSGALLILISFTYQLLLFFLLSLSRWIFIITVPLLYYIGAVGYTYSKNGYEIGYKSVPLFFSNIIFTDTFSKHIDNLFITAFFILGLIFGLIRFFYANDKYIVRKGQVFGIILILTIGISILKTDYLKNFSYLPFTYFQNIKTYLIYTVKKEIYTSNNNTNIVHAPTNNNDLNIILILVEKLSSIQDNITLDGSLILNKEMVMYNNVQTYSNDPDFGLLFSLINDDNKKIVKDIYNASLIKLFKSKGFKTHWISLQNNKIKILPYIDILINASDYNYIKKFNNPPNLFASISTVNSILENTENNLIIIQTVGISNIIQDRYPKNFNNIYKHNKELNNYNNYLLSIDGFLYELTKILVNKDAIIIIAGMSGEYNLKHLNKNTLIGIWSSKSFKEKNKSIINNKDYRNITQKWLFHTVAGCAGIISKELNNEMNLCK